MKTSLNKLEGLLRAFDASYSELAKEVLRYILSQIDERSSLRDVALAIRRAFKRYNVNRELADRLLDGVTKGLAVGAGITVTAGREVMLKRWYLENAYAITEVDFSARINDLTRIKEIEDVVRRSFQANRSWRSAAQALHDTGVVRGDVAKDVEELLLRARQAFKLAQDSEGYAEYRREVERVQTRIADLKDPDTSTLKRAYQNVLDLTRSSSEAEFKAAAKYAVYFKARYNAERTMQTEMTKAYRHAFISATNQDEDAVGWQWVLAADHPEVDICDMYAGADLYGMGAGVFPKDVDPPFTHPHCWCGTVMIYRGEAEESDISDFDEDGGKRWIRELDPEDRRSLMGVAGSREFERSPDDWRDLVNGWEDHERPKNLVPERLLYGR